MPDGSRAQDNRLDHCAKAMTSITRDWAVLEASGPRAGPVRDAITQLEPVFHAQMVLALERWIADGPGADGPATTKLRHLASRITASQAPVEDDPDAETPPHLTAIDFVQLWPAVLKEQRGGGN